jgi:hypothetical protein
MTQMFERAKIVHALDRAAAVNGELYFYSPPPPCTHTA